MNKCIILVSIVFIYVTKSVLAQESDILSKIILPNPNTFQFTTYGNLKLNNNTGGLSHSIPIYTIKYKDIEHPISLSYSSNGVSLDKLGGSIGIDWILNAGGTIARIVKGGVDEDNHFWKFNDDPFYKDLSLEDALDIARKHSVIGSSGAQENQVPTDTERDWYSFKVNELSESFYRTDEALPGNGQKLDPEGFAIESDQHVKINNARAPFFEIIDSKGYRYKFENTESSQTFITSTSENGESNIPTREYALTGWNLTKLISPTGNILTFEYIRESINYHAGISTQLKVQSQMPFGSMNSSPKITETRTYSNVNAEVNYLSKIRFSGGHIDFSYSMREDRLDRGGLLLKEISVFSSDSLLQKTKLSYSQTESPNRGLTISGNALPLKHDWRYRYFLEKIIFFDSKDEIVNHYYFEYYNKEKLPSLFSLARDAYGYCNEVYDNTGLFDTRFSKDTLLRKTLPAYILQNYFKNNLEVNPNTIHYGMLKSIKYPTKGRTEFTYEPNKTLAEAFRQTTTDKTTSVLIEAGVHYETGEQFSTTKNHIEFVSNTDKVNIRATGTMFGKENNMRFAVTLYDVTKKINIASETGVLGREEIVLLNRKVVNGNTYRVTLEFVGNIPYDAYAVASAIIKYNPETTTIKFDEEVYVGGVRVASITDYDENGKTTSKTNYYYNSLKNINSPKTSLIYIRPKQYTYGYYPVYPEYNTRESLLTFVFQSNTLPRSCVTRDGGAAYYTSITEVSEGNGAIERTYSDNQLEDIRYILYGSLNSTYSNINNGREGRLIGENIYKYNLDKLQLQKSIYYKYSALMPTKLYSINLDNTPGEAPPRDISGSINGGINHYKGDPRELVWLSVYYNYINHVRLTSVVEKWYNNLGNVELSNEVTNVYSPKPYFSLSNKSETNSNGDNIITVFKYPADLINRQSYMADLVNKGMVLIPIITTKKVQKKGSVNPAQISSQKISFGKLSRGGEIYYLPSKLGFFGNSNNILIGQLDFNEYDSKGNLLQYTMKDNIPVSYLWSYNYEYPIAEIKNATQEEVSIALQKQGKTIAGLSAMPLPNWDVHKFRKDLPAAIITTYTYKPLVGILTTTDPSGKTIYYEYDSSNRLKRTYVKDENNKVQNITSQDYHYKK